MVQIYRKNIWFCILCVFFLLYATQLFHYRYWDTALASKVSYFVYGSIFFIFYLHKTIWNSSLPLTHCVKALIFFSLPCLISKVFIAGESLYDERGYITGVLTFFFYFIFCHKKISEREIMIIMTILGFMILFIQIFQQINPHSAVFGIYNPDEMDWVPGDIAEIRNGLYRYRLGCYFITIFCLLYYWQKVTEKANVKNIFLFILFSVSVYLFLTRQLMFSCLLAILISPFFSKQSKVKIWMLFLIGVLFLILYQYSYVLFGDLIDQTKEENGEDNVRLLAASFYIEKIFEDPIRVFLGHGHISDLESWKEFFQFYPSDIGIIGEWFLYGIGWCMVYFYTVYLILIKYTKQLPLYINLFVFVSSINCIMIFPYTTPYAYFVWVSILYLASLYIVEDTRLTSSAFNQ